MRRPMEEEQQQAAVRHSLQPRRARSTRRAESRDQGLVCTSS